MQPAWFKVLMRAALLDLAWWEIPLAWIRENNDPFLVDLTADETKSLELLAALKDRKMAALSDTGSGGQELLYNSH